MFEVERHRRAFPATARQVRGVLSVVLVGALAATVAASSLGHHGARSTRLELNPGTAWFGDTSAGDASMIDGATASRVTELHVADQDDEMVVVQSGHQSGAGAYVVNDAKSQITPIDGATLEAGTPVAFGSGADPHLTLLSNANATWVIRQDGTIAEEVDPTSLSAIGPLQQISGTAQPVLASDGSLWVAGAGGTIESFSSGLARTRTQPGRGEFTLVAVDGDPVIADFSTSRALVLDPHTGQPSRSVSFDPPEESALTSGAPQSPYLLAVGPRNGNLDITDVSTGWQAALPIGSPAAAARYGAAVVQGNDIFVPDFATESVLVARIDHDRLAMAGDVPIGLSGHFNLFSYHGYVWFDDPATDSAGVITARLTAIAISKVGGDAEGHPVRGGNSSPPPASDGANSRRSTSRSDGSKSSQLQQQQRDDGSANVSQGSSKTSGGGTNAQGGQGQSHRGSTTGPPASGGSSLPRVGFSWSPTSPLAGGTVAFTPVIMGLGPTSRLSYQWSFAGAKVPVSNAENPRTTWASAGSYPITLTITVNGSSGYAATQEVLVGASTPGAQPDFSWQPTNPVVGQAVSFANTSTGENGKPSWRFPDGNPSQSTSWTPTVRWAEPGSYLVALTIAGPHGATRSITQALNVLPAPQAKFNWSPEEPVVGQKVTFSDASISQQGPSAWTFAHASPASISTPEAQPAHTSWSSPGTYPVTLDFTGMDGSHQSLTRSITIAAKPQAGFNWAQPVYSGQRVTFNDTSASQQGASNWTFAQGNPQSATTGAGASAESTWSNPGKYIVTLTITGIDGSTQTLTQPITVLTTVCTPINWTAQSETQTQVPTSTIQSACDPPAGFTDTTITSISPLGAGSPTPNSDGSISFVSSPGYANRTVTVGFAAMAEGVAFTGSIAFQVQPVTVTCTWKISQSGSGRNSDKEPDTQPYSLTPSMAISWAISGGTESDPTQPYSTWSWSVSCGPVPTNDQNSWLIQSANITSKTCVNLGNNKSYTCGPGTDANITMTQATSSLITVSVYTYSYGVTGSSHSSTLTADVTLVLTR